MLPQNEMKIPTLTSILFRSPSPHNRFHVRWIDFLIFPKSSTSNCPSAFSSHILGICWRSCPGFPQVSVYLTFQVFVEISLALAFPLPSRASSCALQPSRCPPSLQPPEVRCAWTPNLPVQPHHTTFDTRRSSPNRQKEAPLVWIDPRAVHEGCLPLSFLISQGKFFWALFYFAPGEVFLVEGRAHHHAMLVQQLVRDKCLLLVDFNQLPQGSNLLSPATFLDAIIDDFDEVRFVLQVRPELQGTDHTVACSHKQSVTLKTHAT